MSADSDKSWPSIPPTQLKLQREPPAAVPEPSAPAGPGAPVPASPPGPPVGALGGAARRPAAPPLSLQDWLVRILAGVLLAGSVAFLYWSYTRLAPVQKQARALAERANKLSQEIALMEGKYPPPELEKLAEDFQFAGQLLFGGEEDLAAWFEGLKRQLVPLALEASAEFGRPSAPATTNLSVAVVPATLTLNLQPSSDVGSIRSPYGRVLSLLDELTRQPKRVDLVALEVHAGSNSISQVRTVLELWAGEEARP